MASISASFNCAIRIGSSIAHAHGHQPRDFAQHRVIDATPADEPPQPVDIELRIAGALIVDQEMNAFADDGNGILGQALRQERRFAVVLADEIGEQITQR